jgi:hypothetical protein
MKLIKLNFIEMKIKLKYNKSNGTKLNYIEKIK